MRAAAFEHSAAKQLLAPSSVSQPNVRQSQTSYPGYPPTQTPLPYPQQQQPAQAQAAMMPGQERPSLPGGPTSGPSASTSIAAPISVPVSSQRRGMSPAAVVGLVFLALAAGVGGAAAFFLASKPAEPPASTPAATPAADPKAAAPVATLQPSAGPAPAASAAAAPPDAEGDGLEVETATAPQPAPSQKPAGTLGTGTSSAKPFGTLGTSGTTKPPAPTAPPVGKIELL